jgi:hypothetical protein
MLRDGRTDMVKLIGEFLELLLRMRLIVRRNSYFTKELIFDEIHGKINCNYEECYISRCN